MLLQIIVSTIHQVSSETNSFNKFIQNELPESNVIFSNIIDRSENGIARLKKSNFNKHLNFLKIDIIDNGNISLEHLDAPT